LASKGYNLIQGVSGVNSLQSTDLTHQHPTLGH
jgi:hypothetical protein